MGGSNIRGMVAAILLTAATLQFGCSSAPRAPKVYTVQIKDMKFMPDTITVNKGDTIKWVNDDIVAHDVTEQSSGSWTSGRLEPGGSWKLAVDDGADYLCSIHAMMNGTIKVN